MTSSLPPTPTVTLLIASLVYFSICPTGSIGEMTRVFLSLTRSLEFKSRPWRGYHFLDQNIVIKEIKIIFSQWNKL